MHRKGFAMTFYDLARGDTDMPGGLHARFCPHF